MIGTVLDGRYRLERRIGGGLHGEVFEATDIDLERSVAVKIVRDDVDLARVEREARNAARLDPRFSVPVLLARLDHDPPFVVSALASGAPLSSMGKAPLPRAIEITAALLEALAHAHEMGVFHGDLRPPNIFVGPRSVQISDFGFAADEARESAATDLLSAKAVVGYRAPERLRGAPADARSDIFAVGACIFELLTGRRPFERTSSVDEVAAVIGAPTPALPRSALAGAVQKALAKAPQDRFASARAMHDAIDPKKKRLPYVLAVAFVILATTAAWFALRPGHDGVPPTTLPDAAVSVAQVESAPPLAPAPTSASPPPADSAPRPGRPAHVRLDLGTPSCKFVTDDAHRILEKQLAFEECVTAEKNDAHLGDGMTVLYTPQSRFGRATAQRGSQNLSNCFEHIMRSFSISHPEPCQFSVTVIR